MRTCPTCLQSYDVSEYGASYYCRPCMARRAREHRSKHPEKYKNAWRSIPKETRAKQARDWYERNKERRAAYRKAQYEANRESELEKAREYKKVHKTFLAERASAYWKAHPEINRFARSLRRAAEKRATPPWADKAKMKAFYAEAVRLTRETGIKHHVDHIDPLQSDLVCGLHCEFNLQILTSTENQAKKNRFTPIEVINSVPANL